MPLNVRAVAVICLAAAATATVSKPSITTQEGSIVMEVPTDREIRFQRAKTRTMSIQEVFERLSAVTDELDQLPSSQDLEQLESKLSAMEAKFRLQLSGRSYNAGSVVQSALSDAAAQAISRGKASLIVPLDVKAALSNAEATIDANLKFPSGIEGMSAYKGFAQTTGADINNLGGALDKLSRSAEQTVNGLTSSVSSKIDELKAKALNDIQSAKSVLSSKISEIQATASQLASEAQTKKSGSRYPGKKMWSGGCTGHGHKQGWKPYCHSATEFNTASDELQLTSNNENSEFRVKKAGYFRINHWSIGQRHWNHMGVWVNGNHRHHGHEYTDGNWDDHMADLIWRFNAGDRFYVNIYGTGHGHWNYHSWNSGGAHSRLQVEYMGPLN